MKFPNYKQPDLKDCGPTCIKIIAKYYGKSISLQSIRNISETTREGSSLLGLSDAAEQIGFRTIGVKISYNILKNEVPFPCIVHWNNSHFIVVYKIKNDKIYVSDPSYGLITYTSQEFIRNWIGNNSTEETEDGVALLLEPTPNLKDFNTDEEIDKKSFSYIFKYLLRYRQLFLQLVLGLLCGSLISLILPFLTQSIVDVGIQNSDLNFIYLVLFGQIALFIGRTSIEVIRSFILLHLSIRISISLVSDFFIKLMKLPIGFFDTRMTGDIMQRINDHNRIEKLLTNSTLDTLFSLVNIVVFSSVLIYYDWRIFAIFFIGSIAYIIWILFFLKKRRELDYKQFSTVAEEQSKIIELVSGMQEIKLNNAEKQKRWNWEFVQIKLFKISIKSLTLEQTQSVGSSFINQLKDILISFMAASLVIKGDITLGMMLSIQYIIGQLSSPLTQMVSFIQQVQNAKISLERLAEIHDKADEEPDTKSFVNSFKSEGFSFKNMSFRYVGSDINTLNELNLTIPENKITAIVGSSGSGKTTLLKILMKFYPPNEGHIYLGSHNLDNISHQALRAKCGIVMQEGYVFNDTIANNIAVGNDSVDFEALEKAVEIANINDYIKDLPLGYNTKIGNEGIGISGGQKQRLMIARAVYKNPDYIFFDEATSSLDANNEKIIMNNLNKFFKGKTVVIIAHRLSTVKNADKIIVMEKGRVLEEGTHQELINNKNAYFNLVKNQLDLDKLDN
ncbi:ATP-binding cassette, subfamily B [Algoriella xinjiangensis]|uniref:ATP-binding cassette, subfamily B n=1 Tax=Algoriella xinjiangensis TaxID=684065 RepID=A0A1I4U6I4_9FLAO|nr:peptidase domain-containing ABC transporter [Algoriella xinjiangensis]SFM84495.1 ATP-binding cassette, subfamily B [Algoriella xinjiangensis]VDH17866.1 Lactococcin-G-processing and transport ATP-binding protein LagD [Algoriella xinjiangensis]